MKTKFTGLDLIVAVAELQRFVLNIPNAPFYYTYDMNNFLYKFIYFYI